MSETIDVKITDTERRRLIIAKRKETPRDPAGVYLDLRISMNSSGSSFVRAVDDSSVSLSGSTDLITAAEVMKLLDLLRKEQAKRH